MKINLTKRVVMASALCTIVPIAVYAITSDSDGFTSGSGNTVTNNALALGSYNTADSGALAVGQSNTAGTSSAAIGYSNSCVAEESLVVGQSNSLNGGGSAMFGNLNSATYAYDSFVVGTYNTVYDTGDAISLGYGNYSGIRSRVMGDYLIGVEGATVVGICNDPGTPGAKAFVVGCGDSGTLDRANGLEVHTDGTVVVNKVQGDIEMGIYGD